jgi:hypothetical protein
MIVLSTHLLEPTALHLVMTHIGGIKIRLPRPSARQACGEFSVGEIDTLTPAASLKFEEQRFIAYENCADQALRSFDMVNRSADLAVFSIEEDRLARLGYLPEDRDPMMSVDAEMDVALGIVFRAYQRYQARAAEILDTATRNGDMRLETRINEALVGPGSFQLGGDLKDGFPATAEALGDRARAPEENIALPLSEYTFLTRLLRTGANMDVGADGEGCVAGLPCEIGKIVPLIAVVSYCENPGEMTKTSAGWGLVVQRYKPETRSEELRLMNPAEGSRVHALAGNDAEALTAGLSEMRQKSISAEGDPIFFTSWHDYFLINGQEKGCEDAWRDAAKQKVANNRL